MASEHFDVVIVGAGLSGIGAGHHLQSQCPGKSYAILEGRADIGGTWALFKYPGLRSDSDMFTLGYSFRPWTAAKAIADGESILSYVRETARESGIDQHIRFQHRVVSAAWSSHTARWTVEVDVGVGADATRAHYTCSFLYLCSGYYDYEKGYTPDFPGRSSFAGPIVHPQHWPADLEYAGKRVVVIGSGATAVTLVPAMAAKAAHVTMLQRSPTYVVTLPAIDKGADYLRAKLPAKLAYRLVRAKNVAAAQAFYQLCRRAPDFAKKLIRKGIVRQLGPDFDVDTHFTPRYDPWDQRVCFVPDADLFRALRKGKASVVTDRIARFTETGIELESGATLEADVIVTATGLNLLALGGIELSVDEARVEIGETYTYKGVMLGNVPNFAFCVGYTNASWTLRADLSSTFVCRVLNQLDSAHADICMPHVDPATMIPQPILDLSSGYVQRGAGSFPKQGSESPWHLRQNYVLDRMSMQRGDLADGTLRFEKRTERG